MAGDIGDICKQVRSLAKIVKKPELKAILKRWDENLKLIQTSIESKRARGQAAKNEMYTLISYYLVFQVGVMNMLAAKANAHKCEFARFPALLSFLAFLGILASVHDKFLDYHEMKKKRKTDESESRRLQYNISMLLKEGKIEDVESEATSAVEAEATSAAKSEATSAVEEATSAAKSEAASAVEAEAASAAESEAVSAVEADMATSTESNKGLIILEERSYLDVMVFLSVVFGIVLMNSIFVC